VDSVLPLVDKREKHNKEEEKNAKEEKKRKTKH